MGRMRNLVPARVKLRLWIAREAARYRFAFLVSYPAARVSEALGTRRLERRDPQQTGVGRLAAITVINLATRPDRYEDFMAGMARLEISSARRFEGVVDPIGAVGCGRSHCALLREMIEKSWPAMMICEDDARFLVDRPRLDLLVDTFLDDPDAEVACLAFRSRKVSRHNRLFLRGMTVRTTACYILKLSIAADLLALWEDALARLTETGDGQNAVDLVWDTLQDERRFLVPIRRVVYQQAGYSDISRKFVDHSSSDGWRFREAQ